MMEKKRFLDFLDRFDGGGAGKMGDKFEGGGLLSALGNMFGSPYGSEDPERMAARQAFYGSDQIGGGPMATSATYGSGMTPANNYVPMASDMPSGPPARALVGPQLRAAMNPTNQTAPPPAVTNINPAHMFAQAMAQATGMPISEALREVSTGKFDNSIQEYVNNNYQLRLGY